MPYNVAIVGATGNVGRELLNILDEREFPVGNIYALASRSSKGKQVSFGDKTLTVEALDDFDFSKVDFVLSSAGGSVSKAFAPKAAEQGAIVIDNTSHFRMDEDVPLVVPEVNPEALANYKQRNIIANPNCSTIQMVVALKPLHDHFGVSRVVVSTYQSVSGAGKSAMDELYDQTKKKYTYEEVPHQQFTKQIAFNVIPHIDVFMQDGYTKEEWKMRVETQKILDPNIEVSATCVRVPVFVGHGEAVTVELEEEVTLGKLHEVFGEAEGLVVVDRREDGGYITPAEAVGDDAVFLSRIRIDPERKNTVHFWCVSDNVRKGAALNAVQIAEALVQQFEQQSLRVVK